MWSCGPRSNFSNVDDSLGKGLGRFLGQIVSDAALDDPVRVFAGEFPGIGTCVEMWCAVGVAFKRNGGHGDDRAFGKPLIQIAILWLAFSEAEPSAIIMNYDSDMIGIVEGRSRAIECRIIKIPLRRGELPNEFCKVMPVFVVAGTAAFGGEIKLVPPLKLSRWRQRHLAGFLATDQITTHGYHRLAALRP